MSALASQLATIRRHATTNANFQKRNKVASVLYTVSEAADQDLDQVFAIASNGFQELCTVNSEARRFADSLFSSSSRNIDRSLQTSDENKALDRRMREFIELAAAHLPLRPVLKCFEWLVRRFEAHRYLAEELVLAGLPHLRSENFRRVLSAVELPEDWSFLSAYKREEQSPQISTLVKAFSRTPALFSRFVEYVHGIVQSGRGYHALVSFYTDCAVRTVGQMRNQGVTDEDLYARLLPTLTEALRVKTLPEYQVSTYMILAVLASSRTLAPHIGIALSEALILGSHPASLKSGLVCLAQILQAMEGFCRLSPSAVDSLLGQRSVEAQLTSVAHHYRAEKLLVAVASSAAAHDLSRHLTFVSAALQSTALGRAGVQDVLVTVCKVVLDRPPLPAREAAVQLFSELKELEQLRTPLRLLARRLGDDLAQVENALQMTVVPLDFLNTKGSTMVLETQHTQQHPRVDPIVDLAPPPKSHTYMSMPDARTTLAAVQGCTTSAKWTTALEHVVLNGDEQRQCSLLARAALSSIDTFVQSSALECLAALCLAKRQDFQILIPVTLALLSSKNKWVRRRALELGQAIYAIYEEPGQRSMTKFGEFGFYGTQTPHALTWLSVHDAQVLLQKGVLEHGEECRLDHKTIYKTVGHAVTTHATKGKVLAQRSAALHFLASHLVCTPIMKLKLKILLCFDHIEAPTSAKTKAVAPLIDSWLSNAEGARTQCALELIDAFVLERHLFGQVVADEHSPSFTLLEKLVLDRNAALGHVAIARLGALVPDLKRTAREQVLNVLLSTALADDRNLAEVASSTLRDIDLDKETFRTLMQQTVVSPPSSSLNSPAKRARLGATTSSNGPNLRRLTLLIELLEHRGAAQYPALLEICFQKLSELVIAEVEAQTAVSYTQQILLGCMNDMLDGVTSGIEFLRVDILINCIRSSMSPQVQNRALLLVSKLAQAAPEQVLHGVMPIFTFMSANILRQDDGFSAHVTQETIRNVIPPLLTALETNSEQQAVSATDILRSFVDALPHIAKHRRTKLFVDLVDVMGPHRYLGPALYMLLEAKVVATAAKSKVAEVRKSYEDLALALIRHFDVSRQLQAVLLLTRSASQQTPSPATAATLLLSTDADERPIAVRIACLVLECRIGL